MSGAERDGARSDAGGSHDAEFDPAACRFDAVTGLIPAIVQSADDGRVLMLGWMDRLALARTLETGRVTFHSRSRNETWEKGLTSGNWLELVSVESDCDRDALLVKALPHGPTCHTGRTSCFASGATVPAIDDGLWMVLRDLEALVMARARQRPARSYTTSLFEAGVARVAQKVGEEAVETVIAATADLERLPAESADLLFHLLVLWRAAGVETADIAGVLAARNVAAEPKSQRAGGGENPS